ncbi:MAG: hypothetical protein HY719_15010 [Planctomycetes bacterium]|nr:hypothetical protein [Planctomycetota bacterium]
MSNESDNHPRHGAATRGRYEVWYLTGARTDGTLGFWLRYTTSLPARGEARAFLWLALFERSAGGGAPRARAWKKSYPFREFTWVESPFELQVGDSVLAMDRARGAMEAGGQPLFWDLAWEPANETYHHLPPRLEGSRFNRTVVVSPNLGIAPRGVIRVGDDLLEIVSARACQSHIWAAQHAFQWQWAHCSAFEDAPAGTMVELLAARVKRLGIATPFLRSYYVRVGDQRHRLQSLRCLLRNRSNLSPRAWEWSGEDGDARFEGRIAFDPALMVRADYHDPDGREVFCHNTEVADAELRLLYRDGLRAPWRLEQTFHARGTGCFEFGGRVRREEIGNTFIMDA